MPPVSASPPGPEHPRSPAVDGGDPPLARHVRILETTERTRGGPEEWMTPVAGDGMALVLRGIVKRYGAAAALGGAALCIRDNELFPLLGNLIAR